MRRVKIDELLALNPNVDVERLKEAQELAERLREAGLELAPRYRLATPLTGRRLPRHVAGRRAEHAPPMARRH